MAFFRPDHDPYFQPLHSLNLHPSSNNPSFLDPNQIEKAISLTRLTSTQALDSSESARRKLMNGITQYFRAMKERVLWHMLTHSRWTQSDIDSTPKEFIMTVPAIWSNYARDRTLRCAVDAGLGVAGRTESIKLVTEPEAAAMFTISEVSCAD